MHDTEPKALTAPVNKIIPFSVVDGPGSRFAVFFQSCGFSCAYCHNPETMRMCTGCGACMEVCPVHALRRAEEEECAVSDRSSRGDLVWDPKLCCGCDACIKACPNSSSPRIRYMTVEDVLGEIQTALPFIQGITVSGGECTLQEAFVTELFGKVKELGKTAFADTNGQRDFREMEALTRVMDKAMLDVKAWDEQAHIRLTGQSNRTVLSNLEYLGSIGKLYEVRTVIVPGYLPNEETVEQVGRIIRDFPDVRYKLIRFRTFGVKGDLREQESPSEEYMEELKQLALSRGVKEVVLT